MFFPVFDPSCPPHRPRDHHSGEPLTTMVRLPGFTAESGAVAVRNHTGAGGRTRRGKVREKHGKTRRTGQKSKRTKKPGRKSLAVPASRCSSWSQSGSRHHVRTGKRHRTTANRTSGPRARESAACQRMSKPTANHRTTAAIRRSLTPSRVRRRRPSRQEPPQDGHTNRRGWPQWPGPRRFEEYASLVPNPSLFSIMLVFQLFPTLFRSESGCADLTRMVTR